jgi:signal transduction histidine kinase/ActR/RegA family two-component response regulator
MSRSPFQHPDRIEATLRLFAVRAGAEIERMRAEEDRHALEAQLRQSQKMQAIGTLAGGIAHDFNNILSAIIGNTDLMAMEMDRDHPAAPTIEEIRRASSRAKDLVAQILTFSSQREQPRAVISLRPIADEVVKLLRVALPAQVELVRAFDRETPTVLADPTQMHQLMMNLCTNAWQALDGAAGRIEIRLESVTLDAAAARILPGLQPGAHARLVVSDTGTGMDADTLERVFEPFFTTKGVGKGTGLGLAVAHGIVTAHGGAITVRSTPGAGSTFEAYLPAQMMPAAVPPELEAAPARGAGQHIVYVDDESALVRLTERLLQRAGYRTTGFTDPVLALEAIRAEPQNFDALLTDLSMPGISGFDLIREVRRVRPDMPVALTTGFPTDEMQGTADALGCREILIKPARSADLERLFERLFTAVARDETGAA